VIVVRLLGGLGNQLFQYAAARRLAMRHGTEVLLDLGWFGVQQLRSPDIALLRIVAREAPGSALLRGVPPRWTGPGRVTRFRAGVSSRLGGWHLQAERLPGVFDPRLLAAPDDSQLVGYWQSERYFADIAPTLRAELVPKAPLSDAAAAVKAEITATGGVSVHVRRGDFASNPEAHRAHGVCPPEYYQAALAHLDARLGSPPYFVFSDDPAWARETVDHAHARHVSTASGDLPAHEELHLMAACRSHVIANSSFSWWGAWLGDHPDKLVVAPRKWFADPTLRSDDIVPPSWLRL
jgi:hypothetical protein